MRDGDDLYELVDDDVPAEEMPRLERADALLRAVPPPPAGLPSALTQGVLQPPPPRPRLWRPRRIAVALPLAAMLALASFGLGTQLGGGGFEEQAAVEMRATPEAPGAAATLRLGERDADGNLTVRMESRGLPRLPEGGYYVLWLAKGGEYAATCGYFAVGDGDATAEWTVSYDFTDYDAWVVTAHLPDAPEDEEPPWLLRADVERA